jgi:hypothetical protein
MNTLQAIAAWTIVVFVVIDTMIDPFFCDQEDEDDKVPLVKKKPTLFLADDQEATKKRLTGPDGNMKVAYAPMFLEDDPVAMAERPKGFGRYRLIRHRDTPYFQWTILLPEGDVVPCGRLMEVFDAD